MFWLLRTVTANVSSPNVCREWVVEGENLQETLEHFTANVRYIAMKVDHFPHDGVVTGSFHQITPRIREV